MSSRTTESPAHAHFYQVGVTEEQHARLFQMAERLDCNIGQVMEALLDQQPEDYLERLDDAIWSTLTEYLIKTYGETPRLHELAAQFEESERSADEGSEERLAKIIRDRDIVSITRGLPPQYQSFIMKIEVGFPGFWKGKALEPILNALGNDDEPSGEEEVVRWVIGDRTFDDTDSDPDALRAVMTDWMRDAVRQFVAASIDEPVQTEVAA